MLTAHEETRVTDSAYSTWGKKLRFDASNDLVRVFLYYASVSHIDFHFLLLTLLDNLLASLTSPIISCRCFRIASFIMKMPLVARFGMARAS